MKKYGVSANPEFCGNCGKFFAYWDCLPWDEEMSKEQIISFINRRIDDLSEFIRPSYLLAFSKTLSDPDIGDEAYSNLCKNLEYIDGLSDKAQIISEELQAKFQKVVFGRKASFDRGATWLMPFPHHEDNNLEALLKDGDFFAMWFRLHLVSSDKAMADAILGDVLPKKLIEAYAREELDRDLQWIEYHKNQIRQTKVEINDQLTRLSECSDLDENTKALIEKAKKALAEE